MMEEMKTGKRLLLASMVQRAAVNDENVSSEGFSIQGIVIFITSIFALIIVITLCVCKDGNTKERKHSSGKSKNTKDDENKTENLHTNDPVSVENGGHGSNRNSTNMSKHSRQASSASGSNIRPTSQRELPEPPVNAHHSRNTSMSGMVILPTSGTNSSIDEESGVEFSQRPKDNGGSDIGSGNSVGDTDSNGYDHFGPKTTETPAGYDQIGNVVKHHSNAQDTTTLEFNRMEGHHYSQPKERMYDVVKDVKVESMQIYHSDGSSQIKDEDPYNHIGDSDGAISPSEIKHICQSTDLDDPYATVQCDSDGSFAVVAQAELTSKKLTPPSHIPCSSQPDSPHNKSGKKDELEEEDEYAVVQKPSSSQNGGNGTPTTRRQIEDDYDNSGNISPYNTYRPPEPPRLYDQDHNDGFDNDMFEDDEFDRGLSGAKEHTYSKVTARESLASMSARNALNPYETVPDLPENTYATVEGGSGDGVIHEVALRNRMERPRIEENRLSQNSDTYAEIGISGGGLTTSVISNASSSSNNNTSVTILCTSSSSSGGAPIPPSLDSLHQMTKSQTSSEGDRLSDRHLGSPDDWIIPGQFDNLGQSDGSEEDGYSTLTKVTADSSCNSNGNRLSASLGTNYGRKTMIITDAESGEAIHLPNYQTVKDDGELLCSGGGQESLDGGNDPNYESVDETCAKVALLKAREKHTLVQECQSSKSHVSVVNALYKDSEKNELSSTTNGSRRRIRKLNHDYEELDLSPPSSPLPKQQPGFSIPETHEAEAARERALNCHTYEELPQVKQYKKELQKKSSGERECKRKTSSSDDKRKSKEEKKKSKAEEKKKAVVAVSLSSNQSGSEEGSGSAASWDGSKKSDSWETNRTRL